VAGAGADETALKARVDGIIIAEHAWSDADPRGPVCKVLNQLRQHPQYPLGYVVIDVVGVGHGFAQHIADQGFSVYGFQAGARAVNATQFANQKAEAYFRMREFFKEGLVSNLSDEDTEAQLSTLQYRETSRGLTEIEHKVEARRRGLASPDRAEALIMAFMRVVAREQTISYVNEDGISVV
jgi:phage terminase large subunit